MGFRNNRQQAEPSLSREVGRPKTMPGTVTRSRGLSPYNDEKKFPWYPALRSVSSSPIVIGLPQGFRLH